MSDIGAVAGFSDFEFRKDGEHSQVDEESLIEEQSTQLRKSSSSPIKVDDSEKKEAQK